MANQTTERTGMDEDGLRRPLARRHVGRVRQAVRAIFYLLLFMAGLTLIAFSILPTRWPRCSHRRIRRPMRSSF